MLYPPFNNLRSSVRLSVVQTVVYLGGYKFGQLDTEVFIFVSKLDLFRRFDILVAKFVCCVSKPRKGK